jgi:hypothetical protein
VPASDLLLLVSHPNRLMSQHITVSRTDACEGFCGLVPVVSHPNRLMPQHIALYRSAAEKRTIKRSDPTPRYQLPVEGQ